MTTNTIAQTAKHSHPDLRDVDLQEAIANYDDGKISVEEFRKVQDKAAEDSVKRFEAAGQAAVTDGEQRISSCVIDRAYRGYRILNFSLDLLLTLWQSKLSLSQPWWQYEWHIFLLLDLALLLAQALLMG